MVETGDGRRGTGEIPVFVMRCVLAGASAREREVRSLPSPVPRPPSVV